VYTTDRTGTRPLKVGTVKTRQNFVSSLSSLRRSQKEMLQNGEKEK
jgi:hypothetical protein